MKRLITVDLSGKRALVTGGASGIGLATARALLRCGATVAINHLSHDGRGPEEAGRLAAEGFSVAAVAGDVADPQDCARMVAEVVDGLGGLDILINNAGTSATTAPVPFDDLDAMDEAFWQTILSTNLIGPFRCARAAAPMLKASKGCIVNTASIAGLGSPGSSIAYGASKAGLVNLTQNLARALAPDVRVNAVAPGLTRTPWTEPWPVERKAQIIAATLLRRWVEPEDVADTMIFLCAAKALTGQTIAVDNGRQF